MSKSKIDYKNTHFEFIELTRIHGQPTTADLITLKREVRANASTVHTVLGGGHNAHLGMTCTPQVYATVPNSAPYQQPNEPPDLQVQQRAIQFQIQQARNEHAESVRLFKKVLAVKRVLIQQIVAALDAKFIKALRDPVTKKLPGPSQRFLNTCSMRTDMSLQQNFTNLSKRWKTCSLRHKNPLTR